MPIFTRRRLQEMLNDIARLAAPEKQKDLVRRLEDKRVEQALPAEMELALTWAMAQVAEVIIEPLWASFNPSEGQSITFSARALMDMLAGRISPNEFRDRVTGGVNDSNFFAEHLKNGLTFASFEVVSGGLDKDDDLILVRFKDDPAARPLRTPAVETED